MAVSMKVWARFSLGALLGTLILASLAFAGVRFAEKPVRWMPGAFTAYFAVMLLGLIWALWPILACPRAMRLPRYVRLPLGAFIVLLLFLVLAYASYCVFIWLWFSFGGHE